MAAGKDTDGWLMVKLSAQKKQAELSSLLKSRADPNVIVPVEWREFATSPLFEATVSGHMRIARMLISNGADCNVSVGPGLTPLYNAGVLQAGPPPSRAPLQSLRLLSQSTKAVSFESHAAQPSMVTQI